MFNGGSDALAVAFRECIWTISDGAQLYYVPCIGLFFMVSGALLLPVKDDYLTFLRRRMSKIVVPTLAWTVIYLCLNVYCNGPEIDVVQSLHSVPFSAQGNGVLWFMYTLTGLYLLAPILSAWVMGSTDREILFVLLLWAITLCYPLIEGMVHVKSGSTGILYYFTGYAGYFLLGYYLKHRCAQPRWLLAAVIAAAGFALIPLLKYLHIPFDFYRLFGYESIFVVALGFVMWLIISRIKMGGGAQIVSGLSNLTFGVYLAHILIIRYWLWSVEWIQVIPNYMLQTLTVFILTIILSFVLAFVFSRLPVLHYLVGYRKI